MLAILPGLKGMLNYHPLFVHYPIAFWLGALLFQALAVLRSSEEWHRTAARLPYLGTLTALAALDTGLLAENALSETDPARDVFGRHEKLMYSSTSAALGL